MAEHNQGIPLYPDPTKDLVRQQPDPAQMHCRIEQLAAQIAVLAASISNSQANFN